MGDVESVRIDSRIIAVDTTSEFGSIALTEGGVVVEEIEMHSTDGFGPVLFDLLADLMNRHGWTYASVGGFAAASGPGSFTGVRVGLAAVAGLAEVCGAKAAGVSNLQAMAVYGSAKIRAPFFDARRGEIYAGLFDENCEPLVPERVSLLAPWLESLPEGAEVLCRTPEMFGVEATRVPMSMASAVAKLAPRYWQNPAALDANYVRRSDANLKWTDE
jgi:tRNA threonylcarbamoyladenosine biosynthesis protein TsaB